VGLRGLYRGVGVRVEAVRGVGGRNEDNYLEC